MQKLNVNIDTVVHEVIISAGFGRTRAKNQACKVYIQLGTIF